MQGGIKRSKKPVFNFNRESCCLAIYLFARFENPGGLRCWRTSLRGERHPCITERLTRFGKFFERSWRRPFFFSMSMKSDSADLLDFNICRALKAMYR